MLAYIRFKTLAGVDIITGVGSVSFTPGEGEVLVYPHADSDGRAYFRLEPSVTLGDVQLAINNSLFSRRVVTVEGTKIAATEENEKAHGTD